MCYLTGIDQNRICGIEDSLKKHFDKLGKIKTGDEFESEVDSHFFKLKFFKKGTLHLYFKDEKLWDEFNMRACLNKKWLPDQEAKAYTARKRKEAGNVNPEPVKQEYQAVLELAEPVEELSYFCL
jgi:hypothetical protein